MFHVFYNMLHVKINITYFLFIYKVDYEYPNPEIPTHADDQPSYFMDTAAW